MKHVHGWDMSIIRMHEIVSYAVVWCGVVWYDVASCHV